MSWRNTNLETIDGLLDRAVERDPDRIFLEFSGESHTYGAVAGRVGQVAALLAGYGVSAGDTVVTLLDNSIDSVVTWFGINRIGAVAVPVNTAYRGEFLRHQVADSAASVAIVEAHYLERLTSIAGQLEEMRTVLVRGGDRDATRSGPLVLDDFEARLAEAPSGLPAPVARGDDLSALIYTAGTTGPSKGCMISHHYTVRLTRSYLDIVCRRADEHAWNALPLFHFNAWTSTVLSSALLGSSGSIAPRFSLSGFWPEIERTGARVATLLGPMASLIARAPDSPAAERCKGQLRVVQSAPFSAEDVATWQDRFGVQLAGANGYGLTEAALITSLPLDRPAPPGSSGRLNGHYDVRIFDDNDNEVSPGVAGEIVVRPLQRHVVFEGYWNRPEATASLLRNLWFHTGDIGRFDQDGFFYFVDRKKDYLRRRGENISSFEMERAFLAHPDLEEVAVHAVHSDIAEDDVKVTAVRRQGSALTEEALCVWSVDRLPYFAVPRFIEFRTELPRNPVGRVLKYELRDQGVTEATWDRDSSAVVVDKR